MKYEGMAELSYEYKEWVKKIYKPDDPVKFLDPVERVLPLMQGAIDVHVHSGPCTTGTRRPSDIELAIEATKLGMRAIVNKGLSAPTARCAALAQPVVDQWAKEHNLRPTKIIGGVTLGYNVGGLNVHAVRNAAQFGGRFVWTPVLDSSHEYELEGRSGGIKVVDKKGEVVPELREIFKVIAEYDMVLSLCHHTTRERFIMIDAAKEEGVKRIELVHVFQPTTRMNIDQMKMAADKGVYLGHYCFDLGHIFWPWDETIQAIREVGADNFVLGTDLGRWQYPPPLTMYQIMVGLLLAKGISETEVEKMVKLNAEKLIF